MTSDEEMSDERELQYIKDSEQLYLEGYRAASIEDCPYLVADSGPYVIWMQGFFQHQRDRERVAEAAALVWCRRPSDVRL